MNFEDRILTCVTCNDPFIFTAGEQLFFHDKQFINDPKHCKACKAKRTTPSGRAQPRPETRTTCAVCKQETTVPFRPSQGKPVLCRSCFEKGKLPVPATASN